MSNHKNKLDFDKVTRLEVIDHKDDNGRVYVNWKDDNSFKVSLQDDGKTLKIFITKRE